MDRQLAAILAAIQDPAARALQVIRLIESADLSDPQAGKHFWDFVVRNLELESHDLAVMEALGRHWVIADRNAAWSFLSAPARVPAGFEDGLGRQQYVALNGALVEWMNWDRGEALHRARTVPAVRHREGLLTNLYRQWAGTDPETAWNEIRNEEFDGEVRRLSAGIFLLPVIDRKDPGLALRLARTIPAEFWNSPESFQAIGGLHEWAQGNPEGAARFIEEIPGDTGETMRGALIDHWTTKDPAAALEWALGHTGADGIARVTTQILGELARQDPSAAAERWSRGTREQQELWAPVLAAEWASKDPATATAWARQQQEGGLGVTALLQSTSHWVQSDPAAAAAFFRGFLPGISDPADRLALVRIWVTAEPTLALDQLRGLLPADSRDALFAEILPTAIPADPLAAAAALDEIHDAGLRLRAASRIGARWAVRSPEEALAWAQTLATGAERESVLRSVYQGWAGGDPDAAIASLPRLDSPQRDQALVGLVQSLMNQSPARAADQSLRVSDPLIQSQLLESTFQRWMSSAPDAATAWLDRSGLPEALSSRLRALRR